MVLIHHIAPQLHTPAARPYGFSAAASGGLNKLAAFNAAVSLQQETTWYMCAQSDNAQLDISKVTQRSKGQTNLIPGSLVHLQDVARLGCLWPCCDHQDRCHANISVWVLM